MVGLSKIGGEALTKDDLSQLNLLKKEIQDLEDRKEQAEAKATATTQLIDGMPHGNAKSDKVANWGAEVAWLGMRIDNLLAVYREEYRRLWTWIDEIQDSEMRQIFRYRYIDVMTWQRVAFAMGYGDESYFRKKHDRYI